MSKCEHLKAHVNSSCVLFLCLTFSKKKIIMLTVLAAMLNIILFIVDLCRLCQACVFFCHLCCLYPYHPCMVYLPTDIYHKKSTKCKWICHTWILWAMSCLSRFSRVFFQVGSDRFLEHQVRPRGALTDATWEWLWDLRKETVLGKKSTHIPQMVAKKGWFTNVESKISP